MDDTDVGEFFETICRKPPLELELLLVPSKICIKQRYQCDKWLHSTLSQSRQPPLAPLALMHAWGVSSHVEAVQTMVHRMKIVQEEAKSNLFVYQDWAKLMQAGPSMKRRMR